MEAGLVVIAPPGRAGGATARLYSEERYAYNEVYVSHGSSVMRITRSMSRVEAGRAGGATGTRDRRCKRSAREHADPRKEGDGLEGQRNTSDPQDRGGGGHAREGAARVEGLGLKI
jgi:hypothetical protein